MDAWLKILGAFGFMAVVACVAGAAGQHGLFGPEGTTILAGVIQASATAGAIVATVWQTQQALLRERQRQQSREMDERKRLFREGASLVKLAAARIRAVADGLEMDAPVSALDRAKEGLEAIKMHSNAMGRFPFERLDPNLSAAFECAFQGVLASKSLIHSLIDELSKISDRSVHVDFERHIKRNLEIAANELKSIAHSMIDAGTLLSRESAAIFSEQHDC